RDPDAYGPDVAAQYGLDFISRNRDVPFFLYYPMILPHNPFVPTPESPEWAGDRYADDNKHFAEMVTHTDAIVGRIVDHIAALGLTENTVIFFTGDNGTNRAITSPFQGRSVKGEKG